MTANDDLKKYTSAEIEATQGAYREITFSGPLPVSREYERYESVHPGTAGELLKMGVKEQEHRHDMDRKESDRKDRELELEKSRVELSLSAGKANVKLAAQGQAIIFAFGLLLFALVVVFAVMKLTLFAGCAFAALVWFLVSLGFLRFTPRKRPKDDDKE